jgi:Kef-type K+ transport system membrane component KefB
MSRNFSFYIIVLLIFGGLIWLLLEKGKTLPVATNKALTETVINTSPDSTVPANTNNRVTSTDNTFISPSVNFFTDKLGHPICILLLQIIIIIIFARAFGFITGKLGQPVVIGEIIAGIVIGPSLLGHYFPATFAFVFPAEGMKYLEILSQIGLILFMFIIGMELDLKVIKLRVRSALVISHTSILFAFFFGVLLAYFLYAQFAPAGTSFMGFALFIGIAMSIAAFPVLARIIQERGLTTTAFGKHIITIAAIDDLTAWCILAAIIAIIQAGNPMNALFTILLAAVYIVFMIFAIQPMMKKIGSIYITKEILNKKIIAFVFIVLFMSAFFTEIIGIKALFGAFLAGVIMPQHATFKKIMAEKIEDLALVVLLPLFFVLTGLRTEIGLMNQSDMWAICGLIILFAIMGKFGGSFIAARITGMGWKDSLFVGTLMNTRGLMELIVLNIGYDLDVISSVVFTMMVIMTLVTTFMTGPTLNLIEFVSRKKEKFTIHPELKHLRILISFGLPRMGASLLKLIHMLSAKEKNMFHYTAIHLTPHTEITHSVAMKYEDISFSPIKICARTLDIRLKTLYKTTEDVTKEILRTSHKEKADFLLMGAAKAVFNENVLGGRVKNIIEQAKCNVGVFIDKDVSIITKVLILSDYYSINNLLDISYRLLRNSDCSLTFIPDTNDKDTLKKIRSTSFYDNANIKFPEPMMPTLNYMNDFDLIIINIKHFEKYYDDKSDIINARPSLLLMNFTDNTFAIPEIKD